MNALQSCIIISCNTPPLITTQGVNFCFSDTCRRLNKFVVATTMRRPSVSYQFRLQRISASWAQLGVSLITTGKWYFNVENKLLVNLRALVATQFFWHCRCLFNHRINVYRWLIVLFSFGKKKVSTVNLTDRQKFPIANKMLNLQFCEKTFRYVMVRSTTADNKKFFSRLYHVKSSFIKNFKLKIVLNFRFYVSSWKILATSVG